MKYSLKDGLLEELQITKTLRIRTVDLLFFSFITLFCLLARVALFPATSGDYGSFLRPWFDTLKDNGGFGALGISMGDYTPPYFYILAGLTYLPIDSLISIKLVSCLFDFVLAFTMLRLVYLKYHTPSIAILAYAVTLFTPTVLLNSAQWAQCDVIFTTFLMLSLLGFLQEKPVSGTVYFAIAFCFKLQAIFLAPLLLLFWLKGRMKFRHFFLIPAVYLVSILPSAIAGRSFWELLTIYIFQSGQYPKLSMNAPNLYSFIDSNKDKGLATAAILLCAGAVLAVLYLLVIKQFTLKRETIITVALFFAILIPFLLPHMHERYFYTADVLAVLYAFYRPKRFYVPMFVVFSSLCCYLPYLFGVKPISIPVASLIMLAALILVTLDLNRQIRENLDTSHTNKEQSV